MAGEVQKGFTAPRGHLLMDVYVEVPRTGSVQRAGGLFFSVERVRRAFWELLTDTTSNNLRFTKKHAKRPEIHRELPKRPAHGCARRGAEQEECAAGWRACFEEC